MGELIPVIFIEVKAKTNISEWEKICGILRQNGYEIGQDLNSPLIQTIFIKSPFNGTVDEVPIEPAI